ncbi:hypothetical protein FRC12_019538 [Ceratobasidium sp. 428]|nr:hypothetical protein FRC12_019538 [Ceratobasidium sp. 428]
MADALSQIMELSWPSYEADIDVAPTAALDEAGTLLSESLWTPFEVAAEPVVVDSCQFGQHVDSSQDTSYTSSLSSLTESSICETSSPVNPSEGDSITTIESLSLISVSPSHEEIDGWLREYRRLRKASKTQEGLPKITCPLPDCGRVLRRLHALKPMNAMYAISTSKPSLIAEGISKADVPLRK